MSETDDESFPCESGYSTPLLSPTKTVSTQGWLSPRTPGSPHKSRSCLVFHDIDDDANSSFSSPPESPSKSKFVSRRGVLLVSKISAPSSHYALVQSDDVAPTEQGPQDSIPSALSNNRSSLHPEPYSGDDVPNPTSATGATTVSLSRSFCRERKRSHRSSSEGSLTELVSKYTSPLWSTATEAQRVAPHSPTCDDLPVAEGFCKNRPRLLPLRHASSPLRPNQRALRNGPTFLSFKYRSNTPDRFIAHPRPPAVTRESFELNKPAEREMVSRHGTHLSGDPFSHRLHRSGRLNEELRALRESHSTIIGRANVNRRNAMLNTRSSLPVTAARQVSTGGVWNVGGPSAVSDTVVGVSNGRGGLLGSGTNAPLYTSSFFNRVDPEAEMEAYERRLALALDVNQSDRIIQYLPVPGYPNSRQHRSGPPRLGHVWRDSAWMHDGDKTLLDAPQLRDDYYCTLLAYSHTANYLAVALGNVVHLWSERNGVDTPKLLNDIPLNTATGSQHVTSLGFSSSQGGQAILAVGRADGRIVLWSPFNAEPRFDATQPRPISSLSFRPNTVQRPSIRDREITVATEELLVGDEAGHIYLYSIEWPSETQCGLFDWYGAMTLIARMTIHSQQICGLVWSSDGELFASGGNDNNCFLFETKKVLKPNHDESATPSLDVREGPRGEVVYTMANRSGHVLHLPSTAAKHKWTLNAAVKAMAFCPWHRGLLAIGGGSNDRCIHFYHTRSGTCLAIIDCAAQVTGLVWSQTRREIAATFGFAQPEHPYRIGVFAWPSCEQVAAVPWWDENRALCAVAYPGGPMGATATGRGRESGRTRDEDEVWPRQGVGEGCIVVAASDMAIRFHEIWTDERAGTGRTSALGSGRTAGLLGGSSILEGLHGIDREDGVLR